MEHQVGTDEFDKEIYIISDDPKFCQSLSSNAKMRNDAPKLFRSGTADLVVKRNYIVGRYFAYSANTGKASSVQLQPARESQKMRACGVTPGS